MKKVKFILGVLACTILLITNCQKQTNCNGRVYSRHNVPVSGVTVKLNVFTTASSYPTYYKECTTDVNGYFFFSEKIRKKFAVSLECYCDSGFASAGWGKANEINSKTFDLRLK
jgi:hypothetical protein